MVPSEFPGLTALEIQKCYRDLGRRGVNGATGARRVEEKESVALRRWWSSRKESETTRPSTMYACTAVIEPIGCFRNESVGSNFYHQRTYRQVVLN